MTDQTILVPIDGGLHPNQFKTLDLLRLFTRDGAPVYFVVQSSAILHERNPLDASYYFNEHSCPTNYVPVEAIATRGGLDPHGVFEYVRSVWMPRGYDADDDQTFTNLFPEIAGAHPMTDMLETIADRLIARFKKRVEAHAGMPFEQTGVSVPHRDIWLDYARAALVSLNGYFHT